ncbi:MAG TPA: FAD-dependent oxidoreductase [Longimicrobiales bacterium]|nr:FAD-dependent oxidoreductase [Longimicrobiales bacterium]
MQAEAGQTLSLWHATSKVPEFSALDRNTTADTCVVGAGIAGLTAAYMLARAGQRVVVLDDGRIGSGETGRSTAHITAALDDRYWRIESMHGPEGARFAAASHTAAINRAEAITHQEGIDCDFARVDGYLFAAATTPPAEHRSNLEKELEAAHHAGLSDLRLVERAPLDFWHSGLALHFPQQAQFHPLKFLSGLARCIERDGGAIHCGTHVESVEGGTTTRVKTRNGSIVTANATLVCTNASISDYVVTHAKQAPYRTFVIAGSVPRDSIPYGLYWDDADPYHYVRVHPSENHAFDFLIVGGEDHKTAHEDDAANRFAALEAWTRPRFPMAESFEYRWSGQVLEPFDYLSFTGPTPAGDENVYLHSGDSGNGITHGIIAGVLLTDHVLGRENPWASLYDPKRVSLKSAPEFIKQNFDVAVQFKDYVTSGDAEDANAIPRGEGRILVRNGKRVAAYRDAAGVLHERSAVCTHLKCVVHWNSLEKSWDCPCHGSRFDPYGAVLNGPAISELEPLEDES